MGAKPKSKTKMSAIQHTTPAPPRKLLRTGSRGGYSAPGSFPSLCFPVGSRSSGPQRHTNPGSPPSPPYTNHQIELALYSRHPQKSAHDNRRVAAITAAIHGRHHGHGHGRHRALTSRRSSGWARRRPGWARPPGISPSLRRGEPRNTGPATSSAPRAAG